MTERSEDVWTVRRVLDWTVEHLRAHGSDSPRLDAEVLLAHARGCQRIQLYTQYDQPLRDVERDAMRELVQRRAGHEPVAYLVGHREFYGLDFRVTPDVLVPRPETETLVLEAIERLRPVAEPRIADVCTGSGCIAVAVAVGLPAAGVVATDLSSAALAVAADNLEAHDVADRVTLAEGDLLAALGPAEHTFDAILSNPPYVTEMEFHRLDPDVRLHEPRSALVSGSDGLDHVRRLAAGAGERLRDGGFLALEVDPAQVPRVAKLAGEHGLPRVDVVRDGNGDERVVIAHA